MYTSIGESRLSTKNHLRLEDAKIIAREQHCQRRNIREALEIIKHPNNIKRDGGYEISDSWRPLIGKIFSLGSSSAQV